MRARIAGPHGSITRPMRRWADCFRRCGAWDWTANTWIVFATDHGVAFPRAKSTLYAPGTGSRDDHLAAARSIRPSVDASDGLFSGVDLAPALLDLPIGRPPSTSTGFHRAGAWVRMGGPVRELFTEKTYHDAATPSAPCAPRSSATSRTTRPPELVLPLDIADSGSARSLSIRNPRSSREPATSSTTCVSIRVSKTIIWPATPPTPRLRPISPGGWPAGASRPVTSCPRRWDPLSPRRFMREWMVRSKVIGPGEEPLPSRRRRVRARRRDGDSPSESPVFVGDGRYGQVNLAVGVGKSTGRTVGPGTLRSP